MSHVQIPVRVVYLVYIYMAYSICVWCMLMHGPALDGEGR